LTEAYWYILYLLILFQNQRFINPFKKGDIQIATAL